MQFIPTAIPDVVLLKPKIFQDERGFFMETFQAQHFAAAGIAAPFVQDNQSGSRLGILRGLHFQAKRPQGKLVRATVGTVYDVAVDLRPSSATFGKWVGVELSADNKCQLWVPPGFAHGFYVLSEWAEVSYKVTDVYVPQAERTLAWNDPAIGIAWPLISGQKPILSAKDAQGKLLHQFTDDDLAHGTGDASAAAA